jgi:hypothetical protein
MTDSNGAPEQCVDPDVLRVDVRVTRPDPDGPWTVVVDGDGIAPSEHQMLAVRVGDRWCPQPEAANQPAAGEPHAGLCAGDATRLAEVVGRVADRSPVDDDIVCLGRSLFDCLIGAPAWRRVRNVAMLRHPQFVELGLWSESNDGDLHRLPWELMHDGRRFLSVYLDFPVAIVRRVQGIGSAPIPIDHVPRMLFAVGTDITDRSVRPGAELLGLFRALEFDGGSIHPYIVQRASINRLKAAVHRFEPDVIFMIGHGDIHPTTKQGAVQLRSDDPGSNQPLLADADQLIDAFTDGGRVPAPRVVVLSVCKGAVAGGPTTAPLAARLIELGVGMVVAMSGRVGDQACRLFTRRFGQGLADGEAIAEAAAQGRSAAFSNGEEPPRSSADWALPALFLAGWVPVAFRGVAVHTGGVRKLIADFGLATAKTRPVFCGRLSFFEKYERLVTRTDTLSSMVIYADDLEGLGSDRLLRELGAQALRDGHVPLLLGPYDGGADTPRRPVQLAVQLLLAIVTASEHLKIEFRDSSLLAFLNGREVGERTYTPAQIRQEANSFGKRAKPAYDAGALGAALKDDFARLADEARLSPVLPSHDNTVVLVLLPGVHEWDKAFVGLLEMLGTNGLGTGDRPVPAILTGSLSRVGGEKLADQRRKPKLGDAYLVFEPLKPFEDPEDLLAYQWVLLNPRPVLPGSSDHVYAVVSDESDWQTPFRTYMNGKPSDFDRMLYAVADGLIGRHLMTKDDDEAALLRHPASAP